MEEQRIGMMYLNVIRQRIAGVWDGLFPRGLRRSPFLPFLVLALVIGLPTGGWLLHTRGKFHSMGTIIAGDQPAADVPRPGGLAPIVLKTPRAADTTTPQFLTATLLPGLGMDVLQITALIPGHGETELLKAPSVQAMADGSAGPRSSSDDMRGSLEIPWGGNLTGAVSLIGTTMMLSWQGHAIEVPTNAEGQAGVSKGGLLSRRGADNTTLMSEGSAVSALFHATDFDGHWPSTTEINMYASLSQNSMVLTVTARNAGGQAEPMGIGWHPRFTIPSGNRNAALVRLPGGQQLEIINRAKDAVTGHTVPMSPSALAFTQRAEPLGDTTLDMVLTRLQTARGADGPVSEFIDPVSGFGLRLTAASTSIREVSASSPAGERYVSLGMQTNYEDPLGKEWSDPANPGMVVLQPGDSLEFKVRLDIFPVPKS